MPVLKMNPLSCREPMTRLSCHELKVKALKDIMSLVKKILNPLEPQPACKNQPSKFCIETEGDQAGRS